MLREDGQPACLRGWNQWTWRWHKIMDSLTPLTPEMAIMPGTHGPITTYRRIPPNILWKQGPNAYGFRPVLV